MVTSDAYDQGLLSRSQFVPDPLVYQQIGDQELLVPPWKVQVAGSYGARVALWETEDWE
jgi:hypothetical protein